MSSVRHRQVRPASRSGRRLGYRSGLVASVGLALGALLLINSSAGAAPSASPQSCYVVLNKVQPGQTASTVVDSGCQAISRGQPRARPRTQSAAAAVTLIEFYGSPNYGGSSFIVYGNQGPCDSSGYSLSDSSAANSQVGGISSYKASSGCDNQKIYNQKQLAGQPAAYFTLQVPTLPAPYADNVLSLKLRTNCTYYSQTSSSVCGAIRDKYEKLGGPSGILGLPTSNELTNPDGFGKRNTFANNGAIYWTPATGANQISGAILQLWGKNGYERGKVGYPVSDEIDNSSGSLSSWGNRRNDFEVGAVVTGQKGSHYGTWFSTTSSGTAAPSSTKALLPNGCPEGSTNYANPVWNCLQVNTTYQDGYPAGIRVGFRSSTPGVMDGTQPVSKGFGHEHALRDHNVGLHATGLIIQDYPAYLQTADAAENRFIQTASFGEFESQTALQSISVVVQRHEDFEGRSPDTYDMGLITAFCNRGIPSPANYEGYCPDDLPPPFNLAGRD